MPIVRIIAASSATSGDQPSAQLVGGLQGNVGVPTVAGDVIAGDRTAVEDETYVVCVRIFGTLCH